MSDIADKIYAATGLTLNSEAAAAIGRLIQVENEKLRAKADSIYAEMLEIKATRIAELQLALKAVHRHAMGRSGDRTFDQCSAALGYIDDICRAALEGGKDDGTL